MIFSFKIIWKVWGNIFFFLIFSKSYFRSTVTDIPIFPFNKSRYSYFFIKQSQIFLFFYSTVTDIPNFFSTFRYIILIKSKIYKKISKLYLDMSKVNFFFDEHTKNHIWIFLKLIFPLTNIHKVIFGYIWNQFFLWWTY
jgi:hypothetical protein